MSKSDPSDQSRINLNDDADAIALKIKRAKTDPEALPGEVAGLAGRPEAANLVTIYAAITGQAAADVLGEFGGTGFGAFKSRLADALIAHITPIKSDTERLLADPGYIDAVLQNGAKRAAAIADPIVDEAERIVGFLASGT
jgi:tryptophanyl-tRNA synthetase